jgi:hypothetical protein
MPRGVSTPVTYGGRAASRNIRTVDIEVTGLKELTRDFKALIDNLEAAPELKEALYQIAKRVIDKARDRAPMGKTGKLRASMAASKVQNAAQVKGGGSRAPYFAVNEFGGTVPNRASGGAALGGHAEFLRETMGLKGSRSKVTRTGKLLGMTAEDTRGARAGASGRHQHKAWTRSGYFLYPTIADLRDETLDMFFDAIDRLGKKYGL